MSILPAQFTPSSGTTDHSSEKELPAKAAAKAPSPVAEPAPADNSRAPAEVFVPKVSTDLRIDGKHRASAGAGTVLLLSFLLPPLSRAFFRGSHTITSAT